MSSPELAAQQFYKWYIDELIKNNEPSDNLDTLQFYIAAQTIVELKKWLNSDDDEVLDADIFIQAQDIGDDWDIIRIVQRKIAQADDGCHYVFVAFGADQKHVLKDCMVFEDRKWKIKTAILVD